MIQKNFGELKEGENFTVPYIKYTYVKIKPFFCNYNLYRRDINAIATEKTTDTKYFFNFLDDNPVLVEEG